MACLRLFMATTAGTLLLAGHAAGQGVPRLDSYAGVAVRILQSNNAGNVHHLIDPTTRRIAGLIRGSSKAEGASRKHFTRYVRRASVRAGIAIGDRWHWV